MEMLDESYQLIVESQINVRKTKLLNPHMLINRKTMFFLWYLAIPHVTIILVKYGSEKVR